MNLPVAANHDKLAAHSKLGASKYDRWKACPGSVRMTEGLVQPPSEYAAEGSRAHTVAELLLNKKQPDAPVPDEMLEAVMVYVDHIERLRGMKPSFEAVEQRFHLKDYHPELFGTADYVCYFNRSRELHVVDYKHGRGIPVAVMGNDGPNKQLMYYGLGALNALKKPIEKVVLTIVQPRCYHVDGPVRSANIDSVEMVEFSFELIDDAKKTEDPNAPLVAGDHCRFCEAAPTCPALQNRVLKTAEHAFKDETGLVPAITQVTMPPEKLAHYLSLIPEVEAWCSAVNKYAHQQAEMGVAIPGFKLVDKVARRKWLPEVNEQTLFGEFGLDRENACDISIKSPAQIEKLIKRDKNALFLLDQYVVKESSGKTLVSVADGRSAVAGTIESAFKQE